MTVADIQRKQAVRSRHAQTAVRWLRGHLRRGPLLVAGLGVSGLAVARHLAARDIPFGIVDSRLAPPGIDRLRAELPQTPVTLGAFDADVFLGAGLIVLSPGLSLREPVISNAIAAGVPVVGEIELFAREATAPVLAVTGSNGKSTVATLLGAMVARCGMDVRTGGNLGPAALELLGDREPGFYVLELSSFQLETTRSLAAAVACVLNISPDHLDRHANLTEYARTKARIFDGAGVMVVNRADPLVAAMPAGGGRVVSFGLDAPASAQFGLRERNGHGWLSHGQQTLMTVDELAMGGLHNAANALAALAMGSAAGLPMAAMLEALREFAGLPHRCQLVHARQGVRWYDDSKGTNVGATAAAIAGLGGDDNLVLIAGGEGKGQDFAPLRDVARGRLRALITIGRDGPRIGSVLHDIAPVYAAGDMAEAVELARGLARAGDVVLLSPACASFDMFRNYEHRGDVYAECVRAGVPR